MASHLENDCQNRDTVIKKQLFFNPPKKKKRNALNMFVDISTFIVDSLLRAFFIFSPPIFFSTGANDQIVLKVPGNCQFKINQKQKQKK